MNNYLGHCIAAIIILLIACAMLTHSESELKQLRQDCVANGYAEWIAPEKGKAPTIFKLKINP